MKIYRIEDPGNGLGIFYGWGKVLELSPDVELVHKALCNHNRMELIGNIFSDFTLDHYCAYTSTSSLFSFLRMKELRSIIRLGYVVQEIDIDIIDYQDDQQVAFRKSNINSVRVLNVKQLTKIKSELK